MLVIDRFEGNWAVIEHNDLIFNMPRNLLPETAKEGDVLQISITVDQDSTNNLKKKADSLLDNFFDE